jgi:hypothetical protein
MEQDTVLASLVDRHSRLFQSGPPGNSHLPPGWSALVDRLCVDINAALNESEAKTFRVLQVKEKMGVLRFYFSLGDQQTLMVDIVNQGMRYRVEPENSTTAFQNISSLVQTAEKASVKICEECGASGRMRVLAGDFAATAKGYFTLGEDKRAEPLRNGWLKCLCDGHVDAAAAAWASHFDEEEDQG